MYKEEVLALSNYNVVIKCNWNFQAQWHFETSHASNTTRIPHPRVLSPLIKKILIECTEISLIGVFRNLNYHFKDSLISYNIISNVFLNIVRARATS